MQSIQQSVKESQDRIINRPAAWFGMVPAWIFDYTEKIGGTGIAVFTCLCIHASKERRCYPSIPTLSKESGFSERTVQTAIKTLIDCGLVNLIEPGTGRGHANLYEIVDKLKYERVQEVRPLAERVQPMQERVQEVPIKGATVASQQTQEHIQQQSVEKQFSSVVSPTNEVTVPVIDDEAYKRNLNALNELRRSLNARGLLRPKIIVDNYGES